MGCACACTSSSYRGDAHAHGASGGIPPFTKYDVQLFLLLLFASRENYLFNSYKAKENRICQLTFVLVVKKKSIIRITKCPFSFVLVCFVIFHFVLVGFLPGGSDSVFISVFSSSDLFSSSSMLFVTHRPSAK